MTQNDSKVTRADRLQSGPKLTQKWPHFEWCLSRFWVTWGHFGVGPWESLLSHFLGHFDYFGVSVGLGARPLLKANFIKEPQEGCAPRMVTFAATVSGFSKPVSWVVKRRTFVSRATIYRSLWARFLGLQANVLQDPKPRKILKGEKQVKSRFSWNPEIDVKNRSKSRSFSTGLPETYFHLLFTYRGFGACSRFGASQFLGEPVFCTPESRDFLISAESLPAWFSWSNPAQPPLLLVAVWIVLVVFVIPVVQGKKKHININKFAGLSRDWVGAKMLLMCVCVCFFFSGHSLWGTKEHIN